MPPIRIDRRRGSSPDSDSDFEFVGSSSSAPDSRAPSAGPLRNPRGLGLLANSPFRMDGNEDAPRARGDPPPRVRPVPPPTARGTAQGSQEGSAAPPEAQIPRPRGRVTGTLDQPIEVLDSDSEDEGPAQPARAAGPAGRRRVPSPTAFRHHINELDAALARVSRFEQDARFQAEMQARINELEQEADRLDRQIRSPPPAAPAAEPRGHGFGGAVFRRGPAVVRYRPDQPVEYRHINRDGEAEVVEDLPPRRVQPRRGAAQAAAARDPNHPDYDPAQAQARPGNFIRIFPDIPLRGFAINQFVDAFGLFNAAGPARAMDAKSILDTVKPEVLPAANNEFTRTWDADDLAKELEEKEKRGVVVELDERGVVVPERRKVRGQPYLACCACPEPLRVSSADRTPDDRVWALRCGHVLDQRCFKHYAEPEGGDVESLPVLDEPSPKRRKSGRSTRAKATRASKKEHVWNCPVSGCAREHVSVMVNEAWVPMENLGGVQVYV